MAKINTFEYFSCTFCKARCRAEYWESDGHIQCESCIRLICSSCIYDCSVNHKLCENCVNMCTICISDREKEEKAKNRRSW